MATRTMPTRKKRIPWNKDRKVGERIAFEQAHLLQLRQYFIRQGETHDLALFMVGIDTLLRVSDLLRLRVKDIVHRNGSVRTSFPWQQQKTDHSVSPILTPSAAKALVAWINQSGKGHNDYLFPRHKPRRAKPITDDYYRKLVKGWAEKIGLDASEYSTHSIRRTKAVFLYQRDVKIEFIAELLGHANSNVTMKYLGITTAEARRLAVENDIWNPKNKPYERQHQHLRLTGRDCQRIGVAVVDEMQRRGLVMSDQAFAVQVAQELLNTDLFNFPNINT